MTDQIEIVAQTVRYARAAHSGTKAEDILAELKKDFPEVSEASIRSAMVQAAHKLKEQHNGWR